MTRLRGASLYGLRGTIPGTEARPTAQNRPGGALSRPPCGSLVGEIGTAPLPLQATMQRFVGEIAELQLRQSDQLIELGGILPQRLARPVIDDAAAVHHHGARRDLERDAGVL